MTIDKHMHFSQKRIRLLRIARLEWVDVRIYETIIATPLIRSENDQTTPGRDWKEPKCRVPFFPANFYYFYFEWVKSAQRGQVFLPKMFVTKT